MISQEVLTHSPEIITTLSSIAFAMAFSRASRKLIGIRDNWTCQWPEGCNLGRGGGPARFQDGLMVDAAHKDHDAASDEYDDPDNGYILCLTHHYLDHLAHGDLSVLPLLLSRDPYTIHVRANKKAYPWLNGYKKVGDVIKDLHGPIDK